MKASDILICPMVPLRQLPSAERDVLRRFFTQHVRGMDERHDRRWRRFIRDLFNADAGEGFQIYRAEERGGPFHRMHRAVLGRFFQAQERCDDVDVLHDWIKLRCWFVEWENGWPVPRSTNFDDCSEDEIRELHRKFVDLLQQPWLQEFFWPHLLPARRREMVVSALRDPEEDQPCPT